MPLLSVRRGTVPRRLLALFVAVSLLESILGLNAVVPVRAAGPCDPPILNEIVCENSKPGSPASEWDVNGAGDSSIQGFATDISVDQGQTVSFKIDTTSTNFRIDIYRLGYYGGLGARKVATIATADTTETNQPACTITDGTTNDNLVDCGNWSVSASWSVPSRCGLRYLPRTADPPGRRRRPGEPYRVHRPRR